MERCGGLFSPPPLAAYLRSRQTSGVPSPNMTRNLISDCFVLSNLDDGQEYCTLLVLAAPAYLPARGTLGCAGRRRRERYLRLRRPSSNSARRASAEVSRTGHTV